MAYVALHQLVPFPGPNPGDDAMYVLPNNIKGNDMAILAQYNAHDSDATLHLGAGSTGTLPAANVSAGTFGAGAYTFPSTLVVTGAATFSSTVQLGVAYVGGAPAATGYLTIKDSTGTTYKILVST